jgi:hypothetical protein
MGAVLEFGFGVLIGWPAQLVSPKTQNPKLKTVFFWQILPNDVVAKSHDVVA